MPFTLNEKYIIETETELGILFPKSFKAKMIEENGGELITEDDDWQLFPFFDKTDKKRISRTCNNIALETKQAKKWNNFPNNGIAIARNGSGDYLILLPIKENSKILSEEVYTWFHETGQTEKVADDISHLIHN
ncbi:SMI1/KNR4 family protein [Rhizosphaericola mali]|uniref:SMI1/KNR4 family protein n=1 Tax=Rhizosphaericola mali TaxID=2545455 RepID=A0A5P2G0K6_9BACT|nr:SMI1/KNR4 family protein [Rhizosphaericola mali]QES87350.1 SMI1/KNR4 family protein [Rhizosphaericola mali]